MIPTKFTLLQYQGKWYRTTDDIRFGTNIVQYFDTVIVFITDEKFTVIKNRFSNNLGGGYLSDLLRMKLFVTGKTFEDLPTYSHAKTQHPDRTPSFGYKDNGDLFEYYHEPGIL
jgi:hypothetical protein